MLGLDPNLGRPSQKQAKAISEAGFTSTVARPVWTDGRSSRPRCGASLTVGTPHHSDSKESLGGCWWGKR